MTTQDIATLVSAQLHYKRLPSFNTFPGFLKWCWAVLALCAEFLFKCVKTYVAALAWTGIAFPIVASAVTVILYLSPEFPMIPFFSFLDLQISPTSRWYAPVYGSLTTFFIWLVVAIPCSYFATAYGSNASSYTLLRSRLDQLKARLDVIHNVFSDVQGGQAGSQSSQQQDAYKGNEYVHSHSALSAIETCYIDIVHKLYKSSSGITWAFGTEYVNAWKLLHFAEGALIECDSVEEVIRGAMNDKASIQDSKIDTSDELLDKLTQAITDLCPWATVYFSEHQPDKSRDRLLNKLDADIKANQETVRQLAQAIHDAFPNQNVPVPSAQKIEKPAETNEATKLLARAALRDVRYGLTNFRDKAWEGILRARNQLLGSIVLTGLVTHLLLCITILADPKNSNMTYIGAATAFYMTGAISGLFGRFYYLSQARTAVDDFGLSIASLIAIPLQSGLAAIGGVITSVIIAKLSIGPNIPVQDIFVFDPKYLLAAAIFGLTPNLVLKNLQGKSTVKSVEDIMSSERTERASKDD